MSSNAATQTRTDSGKRMQAHPRRRHDAERAFAADERRGEIVPGVVDVRGEHLAALVDDLESRARG